jgi:hypothetical protein
MLASVKTSANGSPSLRAKRARTSCRLVIKKPSLSGVVIGSPGLESPASVAATNRPGLFFAGTATARATGLQKVAKPGERAA